MPLYSDTGRRPAALLKYQAIRLSLVVSCSALLRSMPAQAAASADPHPHPPHPSHHRCSITSLGPPVISNQLASLIENGGDYTHLVKTIKGGKTFLRQTYLSTKEVSIPIRTDFYLHTRTDLPSTHSPLASHL